MLVGAVSHIRVSAHYIMAWTAEIAEVCSLTLLETLIMLSGVVPHNVWAKKMQILSTGIRWEEC